MSLLDFKVGWFSAGQDLNPESRHTTGFLEILLDGFNLTENEDVWSKTIRSSVLVSVYPLALWLAGSWWRLNWEPLPKLAAQPDNDWRMSHELAASGDGYVWPKLIFASDGQAMNIWALPSSPGSAESVRYLNGLDRPGYVLLSDFQRSVDEFMVTMVNRLDVMGCKKSDLSELWNLILEERADPENLQYRKLEAQMGWDPGECPSGLMKVAQELAAKLGGDTFSELAPIYSRELSEISAIGEGPGVTGTPTVPSTPPVLRPNVPPWKLAVDAARELRKAIGNYSEPVTNNSLCTLLGVSHDDFENWTPPPHVSEASLGVPGPKCEYKYTLRRKHPVSRRFELARFLGDYLLTRKTNGVWLASTELPTFRQKFQRAFAAEFLCPISSLERLLQGDYSDAAIDDASYHFQVSPRAVDSLLANNGITPRYLVDCGEPASPYQVGLDSWV